jgi:LPS sulfotransferase NodH
MGYQKRVVLGQRKGVMSSAYIIWTLRRTGGTTLAALLADLSEHPGVEHEPFNPERAFGAVVRAWRDHRDEAQLRAHFEQVLAPRPVIKHCYELLPDAFNAMLMQVTRDLGYAHIVLDRRAEVDRILSLELAKQTGAWGKQEAGKVLRELQMGVRRMAPFDTAEALHHKAVCAARRGWLADAFADAGITPHEVFFEDVYSDLEAGRAEVAALLAFVGIVPEDFPDFEQRRDEALLKKGQNSARLLDFVPNLLDVREALTPSRESGLGF